VRTVTNARRGLLPRRPADDGFTLVEVLVTMAIASLLFALGAAGWRAYAAGQAQRAAADALVVLMREAHQHAVTEGVGYGVRLTPAGGPWVLLRSPATDCTGGTARGGEVPSRGGVSLVGGSFPSSCVYFKPRGTATPGTVQVVRDGTSTAYTITVEGLTGRASIS
jgi:type IV fimbrial biogenesis protein FimT